jgi:signal transduction histidine kinase
MAPDMSMASTQSVLLVEDNPGDARLLKEMFQEQDAHNVDLRHVERMADAETYLAQRTVDIILLDLELPDAQGMEAVRRARAVAPQIPLVVLSGMDDELMAVQALQEGAQDYLLKGRIETNGLLRSLRYAIERNIIEGRLLAEKELAQQAREEKALLQVKVLEEAQEERARLQDRFLSHVSHELRTPLTAIYFFTTNVLDGILGDLNSDQREQLSLALVNVDQLKDMVSDLLDVTRVRTHKLRLESRHTSPARLVAEALSTCTNDAELKGISLHSEVAPDLPFVWADPARVRQILINLVDNGIKFTPQEGSVTVGHQPFAEGDDFLGLTVSDTGCGIKQANLEIVFDRLAQIKNPVEASRSGLGLGLFIARDLVSRHSGRIWVESQLEKGSTFYFTLPVFSLEKLFAGIFTAHNLEVGAVTFIAIDVAAVEGADQADILPEIRGILERCIHTGLDILLPEMGEVDPVETFFIVACADADGAGVIKQRIGRELQNFDDASRLKPVISSTTLAVAQGRSRQEQIGELSAQIKQLIQDHLPGRESLAMTEKKCNPGEVGLFTLSR